MIALLLRVDATVRKLVQDPSPLRWSVLKPGLTIVIMVRIVVSGDCHLWSMVIILHGSSEITHAVAQRSADTSKPARSKDGDNDGQNNEQFERT